MRLVDQKKPPQIAATPDALKDWGDIQYFVAVAVTGSFSRAAAELGVSQSTVTRRIATFEALVGRKLFNRLGHGAQPTAAARAFLPQALDLQTLLRGLERGLAGPVADDLAGLVRVTATEALAAFWLTRQMGELQRRHAGLLIDLQASDRNADLALGEADLGLRLRKPVGAGLIGQKVGVMRFALFCSAGYVETYELADRSADLIHHRLIDNPPYHRFALWRTALDGRTRHVLRTNATMTQIEACRAGFGITILPLFIRHAVPELMELSIEIPETLDIWLVRHERTAQCLRIDRVAAFLRERFAAEQRPLGWFA